MVISTQVGTTLVHLSSNMILTHPYEGPISTSTNPITSSRPPSISQDSKSKMSTSSSVTPKAFSPSPVRHSSPKSAKTKRAGMSLGSVGKADFRGQCLLQKERSRQTCRRRWRMECWQSRFHTNLLNRRRSALPSHNSCSFFHLACSVVCNSSNASLKLSIHDTVQDQTR